MRVCHGPRPAIWKECSSRFDTGAVVHEIKCSIQVAARSCVINGLRIAIGRILTALIWIQYRDVVDEFFLKHGYCGFRAILPRQGQVGASVVVFHQRDAAMLAQDRGLLVGSSNVSRNIPAIISASADTPGTRYPGVIRHLGDNTTVPGDRDIVQTGRCSAIKGKLRKGKATKVYIPVLKLKKTQPLNTLVMRSGS